MGLELLLQYTYRGALAPLSPPVPPLSPPPRPQTYSDDGVQLRSSDLLSPLDGSQDLLLVLESRGWGVERCQVIHPILLGFVARSPEEAPLPSALVGALPLHDFPSLPSGSSPLSSGFTKPQSLHLENGIHRDAQRAWYQNLRKPWTMTNAACKEVKASKSSAQDC